MSKRAQERVLLAQVGREIQVNLRHMEQVLDAFFRDNAKRADLASLGKDSAQIRGALRILGLTEADRLLELCEQQIAQYADPNAPVGDGGPRAPRGIPVGTGLLHRGRRAATAGPRSADRAAHRQAPGRSAGARRRRSPIPSKRQSPSFAPHCRSWSRKCIARRATPHARDDLKKKLVSLRDDADLIGDAGPRRAGRRRAGPARSGQCGESRGRRRRDGRHVGARTRDLRGDAAVARHRRRAVRPGAPRDLSVRGLRSAGRSRAQSRSAQGEPRRPGGAAHDSPRLPYAEGKRPHGRPHRPRRLRVRGGEDLQPAARGRAPGDSRRAIAGRGRTQELPWMGRRASVRRTRDGRSRGAECGHRARAARAARRRSAATVERHRAAACGECCCIGPRAGDASPP